MTLNASTIAAQIRRAVESLDGCKESLASLRANETARQNELSDLKRTASSSDDDAISAISRQSVRLELLGREITDAASAIEISQGELLDAMRNGAKALAQEISDIFAQRIEAALPSLAEFYPSPDTAREILRDSPFGRFIRLRVNALARGVESANADAVARRLADLDKIGAGEIPWPWPQ